MDRSIESTAAVCLVAALFASCQAVFFAERVVEVKNGASTEEKVRIADALVAGGFLARLGQELERQVPGITARQLASIRLRREVARIYSLKERKSRTVVRIVVAFPYDSSIDDPQPILDAAARIVESALSQVSQPRT